MEDFAALKTTFQQCFKAINKTYEEKTIQIVCGQQGTRASLRPFLSKL